MRNLFLSFAFSNLLFVCRVLAQTSTATWQFPLKDGLTINFIDTVVLQWASNYNTAWMNVWCQNGSIGNNVVLGKYFPSFLLLLGDIILTDTLPLGSQFQVQPSGSFPYIMFTEDPTQATFPVACHAQLVADDPNGNVGTDDPVGVTFTSNTKLEAKTFSSSTSSTSSSSTISSLSSISSFSFIISSSSSSQSLTSSTTFIPSPTAGTNAGNNNARLSGVVKAGIGIGATVGVMAILGAIAFMFWRKRKAATREWAAELDNKEAPGAVSFGRHELEDEERRTHELSGTTVAHKLQNEEPRYELPAG